MRRYCRWRTTVVCLILMVLACGGVRIVLWRMAQETFSCMPGEPATPEELNAWYPEVREEENAAPRYLKAFGAMANTGNLEESLPMFNGAALPRPGETLPEPMKQAMGDYLAANGEAIRLLHEAAALTQCRYPVDYRVDGDNRYLTDIRNAARLLALEAVFSAEQQHGDLAVRALTAGFALEGSLQTEPTPIVPAVRCACSMRLLDALERVLNVTALTDTDLSTLSSSLAHKDIAAGATRGLIGSRCLITKVFAHPSAHFNELLARDGQAATPSIMQRFAWTAYRWSGLADVEHRLFNALIREWQDVRMRPFPERLSAADALKMKVDALPAWRAWVIHPVLQSRVFGPGKERMESTAITGVINTEACYQARFSAALTAIAIERRRLVKGPPPGQLQDLVPDYLPEQYPDPFSGGNLLYQRRGPGYLVYSIGMNLKDDGGMNASHLNEGDLVLAVAR